MVVHRGASPRRASHSGISAALVFALAAVLGGFGCRSDAGRADSERGASGPGGSLASLAPRDDDAVTWGALEDGPWVWDLPAGVPAPRVPEDNPMSRARFELGRRLFYDVRLSANGTQSCASCHVQARGFAETRPVSVGSTGERHHRKSMPLANVGYVTRLTWADPELDRLEAQAMLPLVGVEPVELGNAGDEAGLVARIAADANYREAFRRAFPERVTDESTAGESATDERAPIDLTTLTMALATFQRGLISVDSPVDRFVRAYGASDLSAEARAGLGLVASDRLRCFRCHGDLHYGSSHAHVESPMTPIAFHNNALYDIDGEGGYPAHDTGLHRHTAFSRDMGRFRAPSLRNVAVRAPYMHDGSLATLEDVLDHYAAGGRLIEDGPFAGDARRSPLRSPFVTGFALTDVERRNVIAFLESLTDASFLTDPRFADPW